MSTIMAIRSQRDDGTYHLCQDRLLNMLQNVWGTSAVDLTPHPNDRLRLFGILMTLPRLRPHFQRLCDGITVRDQLDSAELSLKQIYADIRLAFNNDEIVVKLPEAASDLENIHLLDPNDESRISIDRDREKLKLIRYHHNFTYL